MRGSLEKESTTKASANVQLLRSPQNQSVPEGEDVRFYCVPEGLVKYVIWYFQPNSLRINQTTTAHTDALSMESMEIALCQPNAICKEKSIQKNVKVYPEGLLVVSQVTSQNAGKFECAIVAGVHTSRSHAYLFVEAQPGVPAVNAIEGRNSLSRFKEGDSLSLVCTCDSGHPKPTLHWTQSVEEHPDRSKHIRQLTAEDSRIAFFQSHSDAISHLVHLGLQLTLSWEDDQSELRCNAVNRIGNSSSKPVRLSVEFAPRIQAFAYNPWIISASKITEILCNAIANPPPMLEWFTWHGRRFSELPRVQSSLVVDEFEQDRNESLIAGWRANITCVATNHIGANYLTLPVEYQFAPVVSTNNIVYAHLGQSIQLHCNVVANPPAARIFWYRVPTGATSSVSSIEKTIENSSSSPEIDTSESLYNPILRIDSLSTSDSGEYICKAENEINASGEIPIYQSSKSSSFLRVYYPPGKPSLEPSGERQMAVGSRLQFRCQTNTQTPGLPDPKFKWMWRPRSCKGLLELREKHIVNSESKNEMVLDELENKDDGLYYCKVYNDLGEVLSAPTSLSVLNPAEIILSSPPHISYELSATLDTKSPTLFCVARGKPIPKIYWTRNGARLDSKPKEDVTLIDSSLKTNEKSDCIVLHDNSFVWQIRSELRWQSAQGNHPLRNSPPRQNHHLSVDDEGQYICEAHDIQGHVDKAAVTLKLYYLPKLLHAQLIKQSLGKIVTISEERPTNALLSDHGTIYERTSVRSTAQFNLSCYLRAVPPPTRVVWELLPDSPNSNCAEDSEYTSADCASCPRGKQIAVYREQGTIREDKSKVTLLTGVAAKRYMDWKLNKEVTPFTESAAITQLVFQSGLIPRAGLYAAHIKNRHGCTTCLVNLGNYTALPEAPSMIQLLETKPHALLISWLPGFDGGSTQQLYFHVTYMTSEAKYELPANKDGRANHTRVFVVKLVPKLPNTCRCWLPGLYPDTTYWISAHSANTIGKSPMSETLVAKTARSPFPRIKQVRFFDTKLQIYLENDSVIQSYCLQVEKSTQGATNWVHIYTDCPAVATHSSTSSLELVPEWCENDSIFLVRQVADQYRHAADSSVRISHRFVTVPPHFLQEGSRSANRAYTNIDIETPPGDPTEHKAFQYRLRTCLSHLPTVCSSSTLFN